ncbi:MAG: hypothetical protein ACOCV3_04940 [Halanaerobiales bacterium]
MSKGYFRLIIKRNLKAIILLIFIIIIASIIINKIGTMSYENRHLMESNIPVEFSYEGKDVQGFIYLSYWVHVDNETEKSLSKQELNDYLLENGYIDLKHYREPLIKSLKDQPLANIKENWKNDYEFFKKNDIYFIENDPDLMEKIKEEEVNINLPYELKKIFFVYLEDSEFSSFIGE